MNRIIIAFLGLLVSALVYAQDSEIRKLPAFKKIHVSEGIEVLLKKGDAESASIEVDHVNLEDVLTEVSGDVLRIHLDGDGHRNADVEITLTYVYLDGVKASSAAEVRGEQVVGVSGGFEIDVSSAGEVGIIVAADHVDVEATSAGEVHLKMQAGSMEADVFSAGEVDVSGTADQVTVKASSSGDFSGYHLTCKKAKLRASSGGSVKVTVTETVTARASSGGSVQYKGSPGEVDKEVSSGGSVRGY